MIINYPTGLYKEEIITNKNITFTVSSSPPPRAAQPFNQIPAGISLKPLPDPTTDKSIRRKLNGELIYTIDEGSQTEPGTNRRSSAVGDVIDFEEYEPVNITATEVPKIVDIQHNTYVADYKTYGLSNEEIADITSNADREKEAIRQQINDKKSQITNDKEAVRETQKSINDIDKIIDGISTFYDPDNPTLKKLEETRIELQAQQDVLIGFINARNAEIKVLYNDYLNLSRLT
jgi:hypothetical protein